MRPTIIRRLAIITFMAAALSATSCIYERPHGDEFYRTLWKTSEAPFKNLQIEFLCGGQASAKAENASGSISAYCFKGNTATFEDLTLQHLDGTSTIMIMEATRTGDALTLSWTIPGTNDSFTTLMHRLSAYE